MKNLITKIENLKISVGEWVLGFFSIVFIRFILEAISNPGISTARIIASDPSPFVHYILFFVAVTFGTLVILEIFTKRGFKTINLLLFFLPAMWLAPILDLIFSLGKGSELRYIGTTSVSYLRDFLTFFGDSFSRGASLGIRIEMLIIISGMAYLVWQFSRSKTKAILAFLTTYIFIFIMVSLPSLVYTIKSFFSAPGANYFMESIVNSNIKFELSNTVLLPASTDRFMEMAFDRIMGQIFFVALCFFMFIWFWQVMRPLLKAIFTNARPERASHYLVLLLAGMWYACRSGLGHVANWIDFVGTISLLLSWLSFWIFSVCFNDIEDLEIDRLSNPSRPLISGKLNLDQMKKSSVIFSLLSIFGAFSVGYASFYMMIICLGASYIYSARPFRLKNIPIISTFLMAVASLSSVLAGFFFLSENKIFSIFPTMAMIGILIFYTILFNVKDLKDVLGDKAFGAKTLPVILGPKKGPQVIGILAALSFLFFPPLFISTGLFWISVPISILSYFLVIKKDFSEKPLFVIYFLFLFIWFLG